MKWAVCRVRRTTLQSENYLHIIIDDHKTHSDFYDKNNNISLSLGKMLLIFVNIVVSSAYALSIIDDYVFGRNLHVEQILATRNVEGIWCDCFHFTSTILFYPLSQSGLFQAQNPKRFNWLANVFIMQ